MTASHCRAGSRPRGTLALLGLLPALALGAALLRGRDAAGRDEPGSARFAGAAACAPCHPNHQALWTASNHARTFEKATEANLPPAVLAGETIAHPPGRTTFRRDPRGFLAETAGPDGQPTRYPLTHVAGRWRIRMYVSTLPDGRMQVLPAMLEEPTGIWFDYSHLMFGGPGSDWDTPPVIQPGEPSFWTGPVRSWGARCANCHVSGGRAVAPRPDGGGPRAVWRADGVDCEACHGPAASHVKAWTESKPGSPLAPLDRLSSQKATEACLICHMEHEIVAPDFPIGGDLYEHIDPTLLIDPERVDPAGRPLELIYEGLSFLTSRCATQGGLSCVTCHDPHGSTHRAQLRTGMQEDKLCASCHPGIVKEAGGHSHHAAEGVGARCIACHMPKLPVERGHGMVTDHTIGVPLPGLRADRAAQDACRWCHGGSPGAPAGAPRLDDEGVRRSFEAWWPEAVEPPGWVDAIARARLREEDAGPGLVAVIQDRSQARVVRASAALLLGRYAEAHRETLLATCGQVDSLIRRNAVRALGGLRGKAIDGALLVALGDTSAAVRSAAARTALEGWVRVQENAALLKAALPVLEADCQALPNDDLRWFRLGAAREIAGDRAGAIVAYEKQVALDPFATNIRAHLERLR